MIHPFFKVIIHKDENIPDLHGICAGFEGLKWRKEQLVDHLFEYLPEFALNYSEYIDLNGENAIAKIRQVAANIYKSKNLKVEENLESYYYMPSFGKHITQSPLSVRYITKMVQMKR